MQRNIYHYTSLPDASLILGKRTEPGLEEGLIPGRAIGFQPLPTELAWQKATFGLLEPLPTSWIHNNEYPRSWRTLVHDLHVGLEGTILLEATVDSETDSVFVGDRGLIEAPLYDKTSDRLQRKAGEEAFMQRLVPLEDYLTNQEKKAPFSLPEVVILEPLPAERIRVYHQQPLLENELAHSGRTMRNYLTHNLTYGYLVNELSPWRNAYEMKNGPLEIQKRGKESH